ncbi:unnamed protein product [Paramecium sonneborni]|uniref:Uncharacterized protein n=1 Tax=Paramecium sonneborni TaxID=65129 RepID=A0A8S1QZS8_9CILI|nr:unnamed protein product [Paramecium sonneborni]
MLKLNQQILVRNGHINFNQGFQQLNHQNSYSKIQITPDKRKNSLEYSLQKQNLYSQINFQERKKQNSIPDIILQQQNQKKCYTYSNDQIENRDQEIFLKKLKTIQNQDVSPKRIGQEASPFQNILMNRKRNCISENKKELSYEKEQLLKKKQKIPNPLQIFNQDSDQPSNRITFKVSNQQNEDIIVVKQIETPGTAQFMQSTKDESFAFLNDNSKEDIINDEEQNCCPSQQIYQRKLSCQEENFMPVQKTIPTKKPYFQSKKGSDVQISKLECKKIMIILDQEQNRILESIGLNSSNFHNSPRSEEFNNPQKIDSQIKLNEETEVIEHEQIKQKRFNIKDENKPYWKLREMSNSRKKR